MGGEPIVYIVHLQGRVEKVRPNEFIADRAVVRGIVEKYG